MADLSPDDIPAMFDGFFRSLTSSIRKTVRDTIVSELKDAREEDRDKKRDTRFLEVQNAPETMNEDTRQKRAAVAPPSQQSENKRLMRGAFDVREPKMGAYHTTSVANFPLFQNMGAQNRNGYRSQNSNGEHRKNINGYLHQITFPPEEFRSSTWYDIPLQPRYWETVSSKMDMYFMIEDHRTNILHAIEVNEVGQLYGVTQLTTNNHYQLLLCDIQKRVMESTFESCNLIRLYPNNRNHANEFLFIHNQGNLLKSILEEIDFWEIKRRLDRKPAGMGTDRQPEKRNISYGYATVAYTSDKRGFNIPAVLAGSTDSFAKNLFLTGTAVVKSNCIPKEFAYTPDIQRLCYPGEIVKGNYFEGCTIFGTNQNALLQPHCDANNPPPQSKASIVVGVSRFLEGERLGVVFYNKKSIEDTIPRIEAIESVCKSLAATYNDLPVFRKCITWETKSSLMSAPGYYDIDGVHYSVPCNIDPLQYHQLFVDSFCRLASSVVFTMPGVMAFISCYELYPQTAYYLSVTTDHYLRTKVHDPMRGNQFQTLHDISMGMIMLRCRHSKTREKNEKMGIFRFAARNEPSVEDVPSPESIQETAEGRLNFALAVWKWHPVEPKDRKTAFEVYQQVLVFFSSTSRHGSGALSSQHAVGILAILGILPPWIRTIATIKGRLQSDLAKLFPKPCHLWQDGKYQRSTMATIGRYMERECGGIWTPAVVENYLCKYARMEKTSHSDTRFVDVHRADEILLEYQTGDILVVTVGDKLSMSDNIGMLCRNWEFDEGGFTASDIAEKCFRDLSDKFRRLPPNKLISLRVPAFQRNFMTRFPTVGVVNCLPREIYATINGSTSPMVPN